MDLADRKYGYPHKMYVHGIPNPNVGKLVNMGFTQKDGERTPILGPGPEFTFAKFYTQHFFDEGYDDEAFAALNEAIRSGGYSFRTEEGKLFWLPVVNH